MYETILQTVSEDLRAPSLGTLGSEALLCSYHTLAYCCQPQEQSPQTSTKLVRISQLLFPPVFLPRCLPFHWLYPSQPSAHRVLLPPWALTP